MLYENNTIVNVFLFCFMFNQNKMTMINVHCNLIKLAYDNSSKLSST